MSSSREAAVSNGRAGIMVFDQRRCLTVVSVMDCAACFTNNHILELVEPSDSMTLLPLPSFVSFSTTEPCEPLMIFLDSGEIEDQQFEAYCGRRGRGRCAIFR